MKVTAVTVAALLAAAQSFAQGADTTQTAKSTGIHFGVDFGADYSTLHTANTDQQTIKDVKNTKQAGFSMGLVAEYAFSKQLSVILNPELSYDNTSLSVLHTDNSHYTYQTLVTAGAAALVKYRIVKCPVNPYLVLGAQYELPIVTAAMNGADQMVRPNVSLDLGIGMKRAFPNFVFAPEIRYAYGLTNIGAVPGIPETRRQTVSVILSFGG